MLVCNSYRWSGCALALLLVAGCEVKVGNDDADGAAGSGSGTNAESDEETAEGSTVGNPGLTVSGRGSDDGDDTNGANGTSNSASDTVVEGSSDSGAASDSGDGGDQAASSSGESDTQRVGDSDGGDDVDEQGATVVDLNNSTPLFLQAECDSLPPTDVEISSDRGAPTRIETGQLVGGRIAPDSVTNKEHYWQIELAKGFYHFVLDSETSTGDSGNIGVDFEWLDSDGVEQGRLVHGNEIASRYRDAVFVEIEEDTVMGLKVTPVWGTEDYLFALFPNGTEVPSPYFSNCPTITPLTLGEAAEFTLAASGDGSTAWYEVDLSVGDYLFRTEATLTSGSSGNIGWNIHARDQFGQVSRHTRTQYANEIDVSFAAQSTLSVGEDGHFFITVHNSFGELDATLTVSEE